MKDFDKDPLGYITDWYIICIAVIWIPGCLTMIGVTIYLFWPYLF